MIKALLIFFFLSADGVLAQRGHYEDPKEYDVSSPLYCGARGDGSFGKIGSKTYPISYHYQMELVADKPDDDPQTAKAVILHLEKAFANFLIQTAYFDEECGKRRRLQSDSAAVGLTADPGDEPLDVRCVIPPLQIGSCLVVEGGLQVYAVEEASDMASDLHSQLRDAMNRGDFDDTHKKLLYVRYIEDDLLPDDSTTDPPPQSQTEPRSEASTVQNTTAVIAGATAGAIFLLVAVASYRRFGREGKLDSAEFPSPKSELEPV